MLAHVEHHQLGPRLFIGPARIHHWHLGAALILTSTLLPTPAAMLTITFGAYLITVDRHDLPGAARSTPHQSRRNGGC